MIIRKDLKMNVTAIQNSNNVISQKNTSPTFGMRIDIKPQDVEKVWSPEELKAFKRMFADVKTAKGKEIFASLIKPFMEQFD